MGGAHFDDRFDRVGAGPWLFSGFTKAVPIEMAGEWHAIGASLSPLGWAALTQTHFDDHLDRFIPAEELLGPDIVAFSRDLIARDLAGEVTGEAACEELARWIEERLVAVPIAHAHEAALVTQLRAELGAMNDVTLFGPADAAGIVSFALDGVHPHDLGTILDEANVAIRAGHHCAQPLMDYLGVPATARASFGLYSSDTDVDALLEGIARTRRIFG